MDPSGYYKASENVFDPYEEEKGKRKMTNMTTEELINNFGTEIHEKKFENINFNIMELDAISFSDCEFYKCTICFNNVNQIVICNSTFDNSYFHVSLNDPEILTENCTFRECNFDNIRIEGFTYQSDIMDSNFYKCNFMKLIINSDISVQGGKICDSKIEHIESKINMLLELEVSNCVADEIQLDSAVLKCKFDTVEIKKLIYQGEQDKNIFSMFKY